MINGVMAPMENGGKNGGMTDEHNILHEKWYGLEEDPFSDFKADYAAGKGVFMRSLASYVAGLTNSPNKEDLVQFIDKNANAVWNNRGSDNQFTLNWNLKADDQNPPAGQEPGSLPGPVTDLNDLIMQTSASRH